VRAALTRQVAELTALALRTVDAVPARELPAVDRALGLTRAALEAIAAHAGVTVTEAGTPPPVDLEAVFEATEAPGQPVTAAELAQAEADWTAALDRGYRHRDLIAATAGPLLAPREVAARLGVSTVTVNTWRTQGRLLALRLDHHQYHYPLFQFADSPAEGQAGVVDGFAELLAWLGDRDAWSTVQLLMTPDPFLGGQRPINVLRAGGAEARDRLRRWAAGAGELGH
jgi:hypothetical protein